MGREEDGRKGSDRLHVLKERKGRREADLSVVTQMRKNKVEEVKEGKQRRTRRLKHQTRERCKGG